MIIQKLHLKNFGKFQDQEIYLKEGINVIYGENESGKSTVHTFLQSMLFGIRRLRGRASKTDTYVKYAPWKHTGWYEGSITFSCGEKQFRLDRSFQKNGEDAVLFCETDGELLSVIDGDLRMLLGNLSETAYCNTISVGQAKSNTEEGLYQELQEYLSKFQGSGDMRFYPEKALEILKQKKKQMEKRESEILNRRKQEEERISYEIGYEQREMEGIREKIRNLPQLPVEQKPEKQEKTRGVQSLSRKFLGVSMALLCMAAFFHKLAWYFLGIPLAMMLLEEWLFFTSRKNRKQEGEEEELLQRRIKREERERTLLENLQEHQLKLENLQEEYEEMREQREDILSVRKDIQMVSEAQKRLKEAALKMQDLTGGLLQKKISEIFSSLTEGKYRQVILEEDFTIHLDTGEKCLDLYQVSYGTVEQVYLALRLACGEILCQEEELPLILDETFAMYDEKRLSNTLNWIQSRYSQVILFSCNKREIQALERLKLPYHLVSLSGQERRYDG